MQHVANKTKINSRQIPTKNIFYNLKTDYFIFIVFNHLQKKKSLELIKYNNAFKKILHLNINDYKEYSEKYSLIEIEIKPIKGKYGTFINIKSEGKNCFRVCFNDDKTEIKRNYLCEDDKATKIKIIIDYQIISFKELFYYCKCIESIYFKKFYRTNINNMSYMFFGCSFLKEMNLSNFKTTNVTDMSRMFGDCSLLKKIDLSNFNNNNLINLESIFYRCSSLKEINLSNFKTINVTNMSEMFYGCSSLKELNLSKFNTNNVSNMKNMFRECSSLKELNLSNFNTNNVTNMFGMFDNCSSLKELNLSNFIINNGTVISEMFISCSSLKELNLPYFNDDKIFCNCRGIFFGCSNELKNKVKIQNKKLMI